MSVPLTFLIVDDDIPLTVFFKETLHYAGHRVFVAVNEHGALEVARQESIDIMICDLMLPGMFGSSVIDVVKQINKEVFCVLISGHSLHLTEHAERFVNADMVIAKPVLKETLNKIVKQYYLTQELKNQTT
jgi:two-component SAPR family response regulator